MKPPMSELAKQGLLWVAVAVIVLLVYQSLSPKLAGSEQQMSYSEFVTQVKNDNVASITASANLPTVVTGKLKDGSSLRTVLPVFGDDQLQQTLESHRVKGTQEPGDDGEIERGVRHGAAEDAEVGERLAEVGTPVHHLGFAGVEGEQHADAG